MAIELPDVEQEWTANVAPYIAAMAEMVASVRAAKDESLAAIAEIQAALDALHGQNVDIGINAEGAAATEAAAKATEDLAHESYDAATAQAILKAVAAGNQEEADRLAAAWNAARASADGLTGATADLAGAQAADAEATADVARETLMLVGAQAVSANAARESARAMVDLGLAEAAVAEGQRLLRDAELGTAAVA